MDKVQLRNSGITVSRLIFGTGGLHLLRSQRERRRLLSAAAHCGFGHFDTSPYYGFGLAERELGYVLAERPDLGVTTKVGLYPPGGAEQAAWLVLARKAIGRAVPRLSRPLVDFSLARAKRSLESSLRRLRRDRVELLLLHEPEAALLATDEWSRWLEYEVESGRVGDFGAAGAPQALRRLRHEAPALARLAQTGGSDQALIAALDPQIRYGLIRSLEASPGEAAVRALLAEEIAAHRDRALIVWSRRAERLPGLVSAARR